MRHSRHPGTLELAASTKAPAVGPVDWTVLVRRPPMLTAHKAAFWTVTARQYAPLHCTYVQHESSVLLVG